MLAKKTAAQYVEELDLEKHPEGGYFKQVYKADDEVTPTNKQQYNGENRKAGTSIYFLLDGKDFSAWHKLKSDETWHHYDGCPIKIYIINEKKLEMHVLGKDNANFQITIKKNSWFAAELVDKSSFGLVGCNVNPGFEYKDFELAERDKLIGEYPEHKNIIIELTRVNQPTSTPTLF